MSEISRRNVIVGLGAAAGLAACGAPSAAAPRKVGIAVAGLGFIAVDNVIPSIQKSSHARLAGLVDIDTARLDSVGRKFNIGKDAQYTQESFDRILDNPDIDAVYIAVPNAFHADYAIRAARAGKHVLCEKPMAVTVAECEAMIDASEKAGKSLAIAYRLQHSPHHQELVRSLRDQEFGKLKVMRADIGYPLGEDGGWRLNRSLAGGGVLLEQGVYSVNAACAMAGEDPVEVRGYEMKSDLKRFAQVDETVAWTMMFPSGAVAHCATSYTMPANTIWAGSQAGWFELDKAFSFDEIGARKSEGSVSISQVDQIALQTDNFCKMIQDNVPPGAGISARDGMRDVRIINAIYESIRTGTTIQVASV